MTAQPQPIRKPDIIRTEAQPPKLPPWFVEYLTQRRRALLTELREINRQLGLPQS
jgi:hypothetical protein